MRSPLRLCLVAVLCLSYAVAQQTSSNVSSVAVPHLVQFGGVIRDAAAKPMTGTVGVTFAFYKDQEGGTALWMETQNVVLDGLGKYAVQLGATKPDGLPMDLFSSGEARWLGVKVEGQAEQARVLLLSVPYALKAADAETVGGLPPTAFVLAAPANAPSSTNGTTAASAPPPASNVTTAGGTANTVPLWSTATDIENSAITQTGSGSTAKIGIGTTTPSSTLDVKGGANIRGTLSLNATGAATATAGKNSQPENFAASSFSSTTSAAVNQTFQWKAEPTGNNTANPGGTLNLLFGKGTSAPTETGLKIASNGQLTFPAGQTFPGTGTITGVTASSGGGLSGGGTSGNVSLSLINTCSNGQLLKWNGSTWGCSTPTSGTVTSVGLTAPSSDYSVSGSPITGSGTLALAWTVAPTSANTANAIVKRDASGNFSSGAVTAASFFGNGSGVTNVNAATLGGLPASSFAGLGSNTFAGRQTIAGNGVNTTIGDPGCGPGYAAIAFGDLNCSTFSLLGNGVNTWINRAQGGYVYFNEADTNEVNIAPGGGLSSIPISSTQPAFTGIASSTASAFFARADAAAAFSGTGTSPYGAINVANLGQGYPGGVFIGGDNTAQLGTAGSGTIGNGGVDNPPIPQQGSGGYGGEFNGGSTTLGIAGSGVIATGGSADSDGEGGAGGVFIGGDTVTGTYGGEGIFAESGKGNDLFPPYSGDFLGNVSVSGTIFAGQKNFKIDHPLDPANKYLVHASIESSEALTLYTGNAVLDDGGTAVVQMPEWFSALNRDFRYQLTPIGSFASLYIAQEIEHNQFHIAGGRPGMKVSWQITCVRQDAYAKAHPMIVEPEKDSREWDHYLHPELYGAREEAGMEWAHHPQIMQQIKKHRETASNAHGVSVR